MCGRLQLDDKGRRAEDTWVTYPPFPSNLGSGFHAGRRGFLRLESYPAEPLTLIFGHQMYR